MPKTILVTGGAGYLGSHMVLLLAEHGYDVVVVDNLFRGFSEAVLAGQLQVLDLTDRAALTALFAETSIDAVMHFAGVAYVGESVQRPDLYYQHNLLATACLLDAMRHAEVDCGIFSSSCAVYGLPETLPITEATVPRPLTPYGRSKWMTEQIIHDYDRAFGARSICLRYFNAAGADPLGRVGNRSQPQTRIIPLTVQAASGRHPALHVFGTDYPTADGTCVRDYVHVVDLCQAHLQALEVLLSGGGSATYNLGSGRGYSIREILNTTHTVTGREIPVIFGDRRAGDPPCLVADSQLARTALGWTPQRSDLQTIIEDEWAWEQRLCRELGHIIG